MYQRAPARDPSESKKKRGRASGAASSNWKRARRSGSSERRLSGNATYRSPRLAASAMNVGETSAGSRRSRTVRYPFSTSQPSPAADGRLPPASLGSTEAKRAIPVPAPDDVSAERLRLTSSSARAAPEPAEP